MLSVSASIHQRDPAIAPWEWPRIDAPGAKRRIVSSRPLLPRRRMPLPLIPAITVSDQERLSSLQVEVNISAYVAHANRSIFGEDTDSFLPERWLRDHESLNRMDNYFLAVRPSPPGSFPYLSGGFPFSPANSCSSDGCYFLTYPTVRKRFPQLSREKHSPNGNQRAASRARDALRFRVRIGLGDWEKFGFVGVKSGCASNELKDNISIAKNKDSNKRKSVLDLASSETPRHLRPRDILIGTDKIQPYDIPLVHPKGKGQRAKGKGTYP